MAKAFDGQKKAKLGTEKNPAAVTVKTKKRMAEVEKIFEENGWNMQLNFQVRDSIILQIPLLLKGDLP
jgi:hypothetical protein